jgi:hypothetical protein
MPSGLRDPTSGSKPAGGRAGDVLARVVGDHERVMRRGAGRGERALEDRRGRLRGADLGGDDDRIDEASKACALDLLALEVGGPFVTITTRAGASERRKSSAPGVSTYRARLRSRNRPASVAACSSGRPCYATARSQTELRYAATARGSSASTG